MFHYAVLLVLILPAWCSAVLDRQIESPRQNFSSYAPVRIQCPPRQQWVRPANALSQQEANWVRGRKLQVLKGLEAYIGNLRLTNFSRPEYIQRLRQDPDNVPAIAYAISGGAWASALTGTGPLRAFDARYAPAVEQRTGGLLQSMTYIAGLSGGCWPAMSLATNNFPEIDDMIASWHLDISPINAPTGTPHRASSKQVFEQLATKLEAGFNVSYGDFLGRSVSYEFVAGAEGGLSTLLSEVADLSNFRTHAMPFPIFQAAQGAPDDIVGYGIAGPPSGNNATFFEWSPFEFGSWDGPKAFYPTNFLGTDMVDGKPVGECVIGFDRASFVLGGSADAWNYWLLADLSNNSLGHFSKRSEDSDDFPIAEIEGLIEYFKKAFNYTRDEALYLTLPNPFATSRSKNDDASTPVNLTIFDNSEAGQALPLWSLIQPARNLDFIVAWDNAQDSEPYQWNNGTNLYDSYTFATNNGVPFPVIPSVNTIINRGFNTKPMLFGCNANLTNTHDLQAPIVLYMANAPYSSYTNFSGLLPNFTTEQMGAIMANGFNYITQGNGTLDVEWPECLGCAAIDRSLAKIGMGRTEQCQKCMVKHCWDGVENNTTPGIVDLSLRLDPTYSFEKWNRSAPYWPIIS